MVSATTKSFFVFTLAFLLWVMGTHTAVLAQNPATHSCTNQSTFVPNEVLVKFIEGADADVAHANVGTQKIDDIPALGVDRVEILTNATVTDVVALYNADPNVAYAEPNYTVCMTATPNDADFDLLWGLHNTGQTGGTADADIDAPEAWDITTGSLSVTIAIIDTGIDYTHPDLGDGRYIGGYDFINGDNDPMDDHGHGTHVAGTAAGDTNDTIGIAGVSWDSQLMGIKVLSAGGSGSWAGVAAGIVYAADNGAHVANMSLGGSGYSQTMEDAMVYAYNAGVVMVCAAGNSAQWGNPPNYPAAYDDYCLGVAATDHNDERASFSSHGSYVDVAAPGVAIYSALPGGGYATWNGTSMAAPHVSGLAALILTEDPTMTVDEVFEQIRNTTDDVNGGGEDDFLGTGRINAFTAVDSLTPLPFDCNSITEIPTIECQALVALYNSTDGSNWITNTNWIETNTPCSWYGVACDDSNVTEIRLDKVGLNGTIAPELGDLTSLRHLWLRFNVGLTGIIPVELGNLTNLVWLNLSHANLSGTIPPELGNLTNLISLVLHANDLTGDIPPELGNLTNLMVLALQWNNLSGEVPAELSNLTNLRNFSLYDNPLLTGSVPPEFINLIVGKYNPKFEFQDTGLCEPPDVIFQEWLSNIDTVGRTNVLCGNTDCNSVTEIPVIECEALVTLYSEANGSYWITNTNWIETNTPCSWYGVTCDGSNVTVLDLQDNQLNGSIPPELSALSSLMELRLYRNELNSSIPPELGLLVNLKRLELQSNPLTGTIPPELGNLINATHFYLGHSRLTGEIPPELGNLVSVRDFSLAHAQLSGSIPPELGNLNPAMVWLHANQLTGEIPSEFGNWDDVAIIQLRWNDLSGEIPSELTELPKLRNLDIDGNRLSGEIPPAFVSLSPTLKYLNISNNQFEGDISVLADLVALEILDISGNPLLTGNLPQRLIDSENLSEFAFQETDLCELPDPAFQTWLGTVSTPEERTNVLCGNTDCNSVTEIPVIECEALVSLYVSTNGSYWITNTGWIDNNTPCSWYGVTCDDSNVTEIRLDKVGLNGTIAPELGNLTSLRHLWLRFNVGLTGTIPVELGNLTNLTWLNLSHANLSGTIPPELSNLTNLVALYLHANNLTGNIPSELGDLTKLYILHLHWNDLSGAIPPELGNLAGVRYLRLNGNQLSGELPPELVNLSALEFFDTDNNPLLTGSLPTGFVNLEFSRLKFENTNLCEPPYVVFQDWLGNIPELGRTNILCAGSDQLLSINILAMDNTADSIANLTPNYQPTMQSIIDATIGQPDKMVIVLADLDQDDDTRILHIHNGIVTNIVGLPDVSGVLNPTLAEYDMTDGEQLGGFLQWALANYAGAEMKTTLSYVGHGTFLAPDTDYGEILTTTESTVSTVSIANDNDFVIPLPYSGRFTDGITDVHPQLSMITPDDLAQMLEIGTSNGANSLDVLDISHCFAASVEELYELTNEDGVLYAEMIVGSPSYAYFAPEMLGNALAQINPSDDAQTMATDLMTAYDETVGMYDEPNTVNHPRALHVYDSVKLLEIKIAMDAMADQAMVEFDSDPVGTKDRFANAYMGASLHYDTTYCEGDWAMSAPDALVDVSAFMQAIAAEFGTSSGVGINALAVESAVQAAVVASAIHNGQPWFADAPLPTWTFTDSTMSLYADLMGAEDGNVRKLSWHSHFYNDTVSDTNPNPYRFIQDGDTGATWGDVFNRYWEVKTADENLTLDDPEGCLPTHPPLPDAGELTAVDITSPLRGTMRVGAPTLLQGTIETDGVALNPMVQFNVYDDSSTLVYRDTVGAGYLLTGTHNVVASEPFIPDSTSNYTMEMIVDPDNHFSEGDETDNQVSRMDRTYDLPVLTMSVNVENDLQWVSGDTVDLEIDASSPLNWLIVHVYQHMGHPHHRTPQFVEAIAVQSPSQPLYTLNLPDGLDAGRVTLHVWGMAGASLSNPHAVVKFNYAPSAQLESAGDAHFYVFDAEAGDNVQVACDVESGTADMVIWRPHSLNRAQRVSCDGTISYNPASAGRYIVKVEATSANSQYSVMGTRNGVEGRRTIKNDVVEITAERPQFIEPILELEIVQPVGVLNCNGEPVNIPSDISDKWTAPPCIPTSVLQGQVGSERPSLTPLLLIITLSIITTTVGISYGKQEGKRDI